MCSLIVDAASMNMKDDSDIKSWGFFCFCRPRVGFRIAASVSGPADTIFALSSGQGRCGVAVVRVSGPAASGALHSVAGLTGGLIAPRTALLRSLLHPQSKEVLDRGLVLWFPGLLDNHSSFP